MDEISLMRAAQAGDLDAFNRIVLVHQEMVYNLAYRMLSDAASAEDATQNTFVAAYRNIRGYRGGSCKAWLLRIATNICYDELRRRKRRPITALEPYDSDNEEEIESPAWLADGKPTPEEAFEQTELETAIQHCLSELPEEFRAVVVMVDIEGCNYQEVSEAIRKPIGTVKSRMARARLRLKECLKHFWELLPLKIRLESEA